MLTNPQIWLIKRAQKHAGLADQEYREILFDTFQVNSSKDPRLGDRELDKLMAFFEAIYWRKVDQQEAKGPIFLLQSGQKRESLPFLERDYWKNKNTRQETSRDRYTQDNLAEEITSLENQLHKLGFNTVYVGTIRLRSTGGHGTPAALRKYKSALERTVASKSKQPDPDNVPF